MYYYNNIRSYKLGFVFVATSDYDTIFSYEKNSVNKTTTPPAFRSKIPDRVAKDILCDNITKTSNLFITPIYWRFYHSRRSALHYFPSKMLVLIYTAAPHPAFIRVPKKIIIWLVFLCQTINCVLFSFFAHAFPCYLR